MSGLDLVGVPAASAQFLEQGFKIVKFAHAIIRQMKNAPGEIPRLRGRLEIINNVTEQARNLDLGPEEKRIVNKILEHSQKLTLDLERILSSIEFRPGDRLHTKTWRAARGVLREEEISRLSYQLEEHISLLSAQIIIAQSPTGLPPPAIQEPAPSDMAGLSLPERCRRALFLTDPQCRRSHLITMKGELIAGTCEWIKEKKKFKDWLQSERDLLWVSGGPGQGKTMLSIYLTEFLQEGDGSSSRILIYFFCDSKDRKLHGAMSILRGLFFSLLSQGADIDPLLETWRLKGSEILMDENFETLWDVFERTLESYERQRDIILLIDGLDECDPISMDPLLKKLRHLLLATSACVKAIVISREYPGLIKTHLCQFPHIRLEPDSPEFEAGIRKYISTRVEEIADNPGHPLSTELCEQIKSTMIDKAQGTYLWVSFVVKDIFGREPSEVEMCLDELPKGLDGIYEKMLLQIPESHHSMAQKILTWVAFSPEVLDLSLLTEALGVKPHGSVSAQQVVRDEISYCGHFLSIDDAERVHLVHQSAKDFLSLRKTSIGFPGFGFEESNSFLADRCLNCIEKAHTSEKRILDQVKATARNDTQDDICDAYLRIPDVLRLVRQNCLLSHAVAWWHIHVRRSGDQVGTLMEGHKQFFGSKSPARESWGALVELRRVLLDPWFHPDVSLDEGNTALHTAALLGLCQWLEILLGNIGRSRFCIRTPLTRQNTWGSTPLGLATKARHTEAVRILLKHNAPPDESGSSILWSYHTPLYQATQYGLYDIAELLLQHKANVHAVQTAGYYSYETGCGGTVVHCASRERHGDILELLLNYGADPNGFSPSKRDRWQKTPLHEAIDPKYPPRNASNTMGKVVIILLQGGADPNLESENCDRPLHAAVRQNQIYVVKLLLGAGADPKAKNGDQMTPLAYAASRGYHDIFSLLLEQKGVAEELQTIHPRTGKSFSHYAAQGGNIMVLQQLYEHKLLRYDPDAAANLPIHLAAYWGHSTMIRTLVERCKADLNAPGHNQRTPLHRVLDTEKKQDKREEKRVERAEAAAYLIHFCGNPEAQDVHKNTPLHYAARNGLVQATTLLLQTRDVDPNIKNFEGYTPLHSLVIWAPRELSSFVVSTMEVLWADDRFDWSAKDDLGRTSLAAAVSKPLYRTHDQTIVERLLETMKFNVNETDDKKLTPLHILMKSVEYEEYTLPAHPLSRSFELSSLQSVMNLLLRHGADLSRRDSCDQTPKDIAISRDSGKRIHKRFLTECLENAQNLLGIPEKCSLGYSPSNECG